MQQELIKYHEAALGYLEKYYQAFADENIYFGYPFIKELTEEAKKIARTESYAGMDFEDALLIVCFRYAGIVNIVSNEDETWLKLLHDFSSQVNYPTDHLQLVKAGIRNNMALAAPQSAAEQLAWDAINCRFAMDELIVRSSFLKEEINRISEKQFTELELLTQFRTQFQKSIYVTDYAKEHFAEKKDRNYGRVEKRIQKLQQTDRKTEKKEIAENNKFNDKETEDLFKIAFRNYVHLVAVADSKAGLLINVNSIIISVVIAFAVSRSDKYPFLVLPSFILLSVAFVTILLSILASRPQGNRYIQKRNSKSYQTFFFGSFDLTGREFLKADWNDYHTELDTLLKGGKENVYEEMYKESFNVRKVLGRKFTYLSVAYRVFIAGLFISIVSFFISTYK